MSVSPRILVVSLPLLLAVLASPATCGASDRPPLRSERPPYFTADVAISLDSEGRPALAVAVTIPYPELEWVKRPGAYAAGAEVGVVFQPRGKARLYGDVWERKLLVAGFSTVTSPASSVVEKRSFAVPPGRYQVRISVRDLNSEEGSTATDQLDVPDFSHVPVGFADLELGVLDSTSGFAELPTRRFGINASRIAARVVLFDRRPGPWPRTYPFQYRILDDLGQEVLTGRQAATLTGSAEPAIVRPAGADLFLGSYVFEVGLVEGKSRWRVERSFEVEESGPPRGREFDRILEPLSYIADPQEIEHLRGLPAEEQARGWEEFWRRRDPTPETARNEAMLEFFRRLRYTEQHFQGFGPGWRTDMGHVYIKFGPPDQIENRPATSQSVQLEIWYYNQPYRRVVFADREGFGRYVLVSPGVE